LASRGIDEDTCKKFKGAFSFSYYPKIWLMICVRAENEITGAVLLTLELGEMKTELDIGALGTRKTIKMAIDELSATLSRMESPLAGERERLTLSIVTDFSLR
jgi:hypothetical protein